MEFCKSAIGKERMQFGALKLAEYGSQLGKRLHDTSVFSIIRTGSPVSIKIGQTLYDFETSELIFIGPHYEVEIDQPIVAEGYLCWFTADFYQRSKLDTEILNSELFFGSQPFLAMRDYRTELVFKKLFVERLTCCAEYRTIDMMVAHHCFESLLLEGYQTMLSLETTRASAHVAAVQLFNRFSVLLHKHYREHTSVQYYADRLHLSPRKLTELCCAVAGKSAKCVISTVVAQQALRYIQHTDLSISQISYEMGFSDESNFRNFFKRQTGNNPLSYRQV
ncbi:helix-turn-helix domain-containing protein [Sphingobacterium sp. UGAL515B_05]|uniref:helix-turn-helix domain-containing protein n=1 Tax=Sphingobacterium sp. UGAL515B_05 TaxID=2986767 RepID=UPI0029551552|nr:helix-turn-helix domain-containing protein [Sphingobacterium sp. UGAL515B_05]WON96092.1 helix-turn-helix domain-containing protein [Sphingobacterium sp. UGAL515B_05]